MQFSVEAHTLSIFKIQTFKSIFKIHSQSSELTLGPTSFYSCSYNSQGNSLGKVFAQALSATLKKGRASITAFSNCIQGFDLRESENHLNAFVKFCANVHLPGEGSLPLTRPSEQSKFSLSLLI